jgi:divalent metal cation (Fe/Co/Zn/Cd) transporter
MKLRGNSKEAATYRAAAVNAGLLAARTGAWWATGNDGFVVDAGHDLGDVISLGAKGKALEKGSEQQLKKRLRMGAAALFLSGGLFGMYAGAEQLANDGHEDASALALATAGLTAIASVAVAARTHKYLHDDHDHSDSTRTDVKIHLWGDAASSAVYATSLGVQATTGLQNFGSGGVVASGAITTGLALWTFHTIKKDVSALSS